MRIIFEFEAIDQSSLYFEKGDELFEALLKLEDKIRPHTMKAYARNQASSSQQKENKKK